MTSAPPIKRRGRRGKGDLTQRALSVAELDALGTSLDDTLDAMAADIPDALVAEGVVVASRLDDAEVELETGMVLVEQANLTASGIRRFKFIQNGLAFASGTTIDEWQRDVGALIALKRGLDWALADALAFGEDVYGEAASQVLGDTPFATQTLWNLASLARRIPRELRNDSLPFTVQAEVAPLDRVDQEEILMRAAAQGLKREEVRDLVRTRKRERQRERAETLPVPVRTPPLLTFQVADARQLPWSDNSVNLIVTSPPYGIWDQETGAGVRKYATQDDWREWGALIADFMAEASRILVPGGRLAINVPFDTWVGGQAGGQRSTLQKVLMSAALMSLNYVTLISWDEGNVSKTAARGSLDSPSAPRVINREEAIVVFCSGSYNRLQEMKDGALTTDITHDEWLEWTNGTWKVPGETNPWEGFEAAMPEEIARRLIKLYSFNEDVICDPFSGSFTTAKVAWRLGRQGLFSDIDPKYVASGQRRIAAAAGMV